MTETFTVRFCENQHYDIEIDGEVVQLMAITSSGTWHSTVRHTTARELREDREAFKTYVLGAMQAKLPPCEVSIG